MWCWRAIFIASRISLSDSSGRRAQSSRTNQKPNNLDASPGVYSFSLSHIFFQTAMDADFQQMMMQQQGRGPGGAPRGDGTTPDKYVFAVDLRADAIFTTRVVAKSFTSHHSLFSRSQKSKQSDKQAILNARFIDAQTWTSRRANGGHGADAWRVCG